MKQLWSKTGLKYLQRLDKKSARKLFGSVKKLPFEGDINKLKGKKVQNIHRLRVGKYRVLFLQEKASMTILKIDTRGDVNK